jgi:hypothetical protein
MENGWNESGEDKCTCVKKTLLCLETEITQSVSTIELMKSPGHFFDRVQLTHAGEQCPQIHHHADG